MNSLIYFFDKYPFLVFFVSFFIGYLFMPVVVEMAKKHNFVVSPNKRTSHDGDIPNVGGINIFVSFLLTVFFFSFNIFSDMQYKLLGLAVILIVGFIDDLIELDVFWKLTGQILAGFFLIVLGNMKLSNLDGLFGIYEIPDYVAYIVTFGFFIIVVNALNLIDGVDGLASGLGILYSLFFGIYFHLTQRTDLSISAFAMVGSLSVFFYYNVFSHKKKIFMGDSGSLLLGYMIFLYVLSFCDINTGNAIPEKYNIHSSFIVAITILIVPLFDTIRVSITRIKKGRSPLSADKNHIHHLLLSLGFQHKKVTYILMSITIIFIALALLTHIFPSYVLLLLDIVIPISLTFFLWSLINKMKEKSDENVIK